MQIGPHMVRTMLRTASSMQVHKASAENGDANLRPAAQGSRAEPRQPQSAESQEEDSTWNPGWKVSWALAPFHFYTLYLSQLPAHLSHIPWNPPDFLHTSGKQHRHLSKTAYFQPLLCHLPSGRSWLNFFISRRFSVLISKMILAPHSCPTLK